jgi:HEAT repeat protein
MDRLDRQHLIDDLAHRDEEIRRLAVERTSELPDDEAVPVLVERLGDSSWRVRKAAVERLIDRDDAAPAVRALVAALADGDNPGRRNAALEALTRFGTAALPVLLEASADEDVDVRKQVVDTLGAVGHSSAADRLIQLLADPDANVRAAAAEALGAVAALGVERLLLERVERDAEPLVRLCALRSLAKLGAKVPVARLESQLAEPLLRPAVYAVLGASGDPLAWDTLVKGLSARARSAREGAMEAIVQVVSQAGPGEGRGLLERLRTHEADFLPDALERLRSAPLTTRFVLVQFLGLLARADCVVPLLDASADEALAELALNALAENGNLVEGALERDWQALDERVRVRACILLGRTSGPAGETLLRSALRAGDPHLRGVAAGALAERRAVGAVPALVAGLAQAAATEPIDPMAGGEEAVAFESAIASLVEPADGALADRVVTLLETHFEGAPEAFRLAVARLLGRFGAAHHVSRVEVLLSDPSTEVRRAAVEAVARIAPARVEVLRCALADEAPRVRIGAAMALGASGDATVVADLAALAEDGDPRVAGAALRALARWARAEGSDMARERALVLLAGGLGRGGVTSLAALEALTDLGGTDAVELAFDALASPDPEVAEAAVACIGRHGQREELTRLLDCLAHPHWNVRARTVQVMQERRQVRAIPAILRRLEAERDDFVRQASLAALRTLESQ